MSISKTSQAVAMTRAGFARQHSADGDPLAQERLCAGLATIALTRLRASLAARTAFFDDQVMSAIQAGADLGTGAEPGRSLLVMAAPAG